MFPEADQTNLLTATVARYMRIEDVTTGDPAKNYLVRYRGQLYGDSAVAYDQLAEQLRQWELTPLFRNEAGQHAILLVPGLFQARPSNPRINLVLFILTFISVIFAGALSAYQGPDPNSTWELLTLVLLNLSRGLPFAISLLAILAAHEFGHYLTGRFHHTHVTLPYFIPFPLSLFGTLGAFIQLKEPPKNKRILLDIGIAGPLAGFVVAVPVLVLGLALSNLAPVKVAAGQGMQLEGNSLLYLLLKYLIFGQLLPAPATYGSLNPALYWLRYFFTSQPLPLGGTDVMIHPVAWAGWAGLLVTAMNLIPVGQLDGGHLMYALFGRRARSLWPWILAALVGLGFFWNGWWLWAGLLFLLGRAQAEPLDQITPLDGRRKFLAVLGVVLFLLVFTPVPLVQFFAGS